MGKKMKEEDKGRKCVINDILTRCFHHLSSRPAHELVIVYEHELYLIKWEQLNNLNLSSHNVWIQMCDHHHHRFTQVNGNHTVVSGVRTYSFTYIILHVLFTN